MSSLLVKDEFGRGFGTENTENALVRLCAQWNGNATEKL